MVTNFPDGKSSASVWLNSMSVLLGEPCSFASERRMARVADISSAAAMPLPETSARTMP